MLPLPMFLLLLPTPAPDAPAPAPDAPTPAPDAPAPAPDAPAPAPDAAALTTIPRFDAAVHALVARTLHTLLLEFVLVGLHEGFLPDSTAPTSEPMPTHNARKQHQRSCQMDLTGCLRNVRANCDLGLNLRCPRTVSSGSSRRCRRTNSTGAGIVCRT
ncbi:hypothetical protein M405DRAFT_817820 [Rhizopogon salebrosus TDB-379]|nr:hypothetical protein M405DRAFT_817820 [Rhizopogon salebrosus TDB-379]